MGPFALADSRELWAAAAALIAAGLYLALLVSRRRSELCAGDGAIKGSSSAASVLPPVVPGLPLLGSALALGSGGAAFLQRCRDQFGDAFTLRLLGQRMTFVFAPASLVHYFTAPDSQLTFAPAVQQFTHRVFGLPPKHFYSRHLTMLQALRHELVPSALPRHTSRLLRLLLARLASWPASGQLELVGEIKTLVFQASVGSLFGDRFLEAEGRHLQETFFVFEAGFELAASPLLHLFQPRFLAARRRLVAALRRSHCAGHFEGTVAGALVEACGLPDRFVPNMLLAVLWASQANAVPSAFWTLGFLLLPENAQHLQGVVAEAEAAVVGAAAAAEETTAAGSAQPGSGSSQQQQTQQQQQRQQQQEQQQRQQQQEQQQHTLEEQPLLLSEAQQAGLVALASNRHSQAAAAVAEAMRLRSFSIDVRIAASDCALPCGDGSQPGGEGGFRVRKGDVVAISPYASHLDSRLFSPQHPTTYDPQRDGMRLGGTSTAHAAVVGVGGVPGLSFGGGKYRCPGRYFAESELALVTSLLLLLYKWELLPRETPPAGAAGTGAAAGSTAAPTAAVRNAAAGSVAAGSGAAPAPAAVCGSLEGQQEGQQALQEEAKQAKQQQGVAAVPGDPAGLLPPPNLLKLVGIKVPAGPCWVHFSRRTLQG